MRRQDSEESLQVKARYGHGTARSGTFLGPCMSGKISLTKSAARNIVWKKSIPMQKKRKAVTERSTHCPLQERAAVPEDGRQKTDIQGC